MNQFEMLRRGQTNIKITTNTPANADTLVIYKLGEDVSGNPTCVDISPTNPSIITLGTTNLKQHTYTAPDEDCYLLAVFNGTPRFFRIGTPVIRLYMYTGNAVDVVGYSLLGFDGSVVSTGNMTNIANGIFSIKPETVGDFILQTSVNGRPASIHAVHTPYVTDTVGMSGKIIFQKDSWMLLAVPKEGSTISDLVADIENKYNVAGSDVFALFSAFPATADQSGEMLDYKPGFTPNSTKYNFSLVYGDSVAKEITGFWCNTKDYVVNGDVTELIEYTWTA